MGMADPAQGGGGGFLKRAGLAARVAPSKQKSIGIKDEAREKALKRKKKETRKKTETVTAGNDQSYCRGKGTSDYSLKGCMVE